MASCRSFLICAEKDMGRVEAEGEVVEEEEPLHLEAAEISLNYVVGFTLNHTMKLEGIYRQGSEGNCGG